jgi:hypothetical protein
MRLTSGIDIHNVSLLKNNRNLYYYKETLLNIYFDFRLFLAYFYFEGSSDKSISFLTFFSAPLRHLFEECGTKVFTAKPRTPGWFNEFLIRS